MSTGSGWLPPPILPLPPPLPPSISPPISPQGLWPAPASTPPEVQVDQIELPPAGGGRKLRLAICWILILGCVATRFVMVLRPNEKAEAATENADADLRLELMGRYSVGCKLIFSQFPVGNELSIQVRSEAQTPADQVRLIPVIGELEGSAKAVDNANQLLEAKLPAQAETDARLMRKIYVWGADSLSATERKGLIDRNGWFGELAVSSSAPPGDPLRKSVEFAAIRTFVSLIASGVIFLALLVAGLALAIVLLIRFGSGAHPPKYRPTDFQAADVMLEGFAVWMLLFMGIDFAVVLLPAHPSMAWNGLLVIPFVAALGWVRIRGIGWGRFFEALGWRRGKGFWREVGAGLVTYVAGIPFIAAATLVTALLSTMTGAHTTHPIVRDIFSSPGAKVMLLILACVFAPFTEETLFRGMLLGHMRRRHRWIFSSLLVSLIFAAIHPQGWAAIPVLGTIAMILAVLREQRGSLIASMTAHALNNTMILVLLLLAAG